MKVHPSIVAESQSAVMVEKKVQNEHNGENVDKQKKLRRGRIMLWELPRRSSMLVKKFQRQCCQEARYRVLFAYPKFDL